MLSQSGSRYAADAGAARSTKDSDNVVADPESHEADHQLPGAAAVAVLEVADPAALEGVADATEDHAEDPAGAVAVAEQLAVVVAAAELAEGRRLRRAPRMTSPERLASEPH